MTNTGDNSTVRPDDAPRRVARTRHVLLAVLAVWAVAALIGWAQWLPSDDRNPDSLLTMVIGTVVPGLVAVAVALGVLRWMQRR
ncbi:hypothetical protein ACFY3U_01865 [Micromonospora sp. NPDC000089]|uniref:hypothetical protein n=1 Tax=unclassified Micromonospora TaxID=2617518 RepID=UPI0036936653